MLQTDVIPRVNVGVVLDERCPRAGGLLGGPHGLCSSETRSRLLSAPRASHWVNRPGSEPGHTAADGPLHQPGARSRLSEAGPQAEMAPGSSETSVADFEHGCEASFGAWYVTTDQPTGSSSTANVVVRDGAPGHSPARSPRDSPSLGRA